ncbi:hypothetical protein A2V68_02040 [candidate division Kazan bacterium RBG_13_50_9]|uniref:Uncharacterized protein n=1 Tax=candidate division Kazan bacterium RBG_13_50_9 TaxID=1798535 RepID=A0A1F4NRU9_UNCK3|nr:MAG: hypothetical protein A2V68_02040 [candidate division Kazan bacterium RBG_13_50_9]
MALERLEKSHDQEEESYVPSPEVRAAFAIDDELLEKVSKRNGRQSRMRTVDLYANELRTQLIHVERAQPRALNDGINLIAAVTGMASLDKVGEGHFIGVGDDLKTVKAVLQRVKSSDYSNHRAYQLWAGLYLDLRERLWGEDKDETNQQLTTELGEMTKLD